MAHQPFTCMENRNSIIRWTLLAVVIALLIRLPFFGQIPVGLNRDEAALGYNAFTLSQAGIDEYSIAWPISFQSFGDQKLPGYIYSLIPFVKLLGLNAWVTKLPSFLAGLANIVLIGIILRRLLPDSLKNWGGRLSMLLLAVSPWGLHFSHVAYEAHLALAFFLAGLAAFAIAKDTPVGKKQRGWLILSALGFSLTLLTYHAYHAFLPLTLLLFLVLFWKQIRQFDRIGLATGIGIGVFTLFLLWNGGVFAANAIKQSNISPYSEKAVIGWYYTRRESIPGDTLLEKALFNSLTAKASIFAQQYAQAWSTLHWFTPTSAHGVHNPAGMSTLHTLLLPFFFLGLAVLWQHRRESWTWLLTGWLTLALTAPALTTAPQHTIRISPVLPVLEVIAALGIIGLVRSLPQWQRLLSWLLIGGVIISVIWTTTNYWWVWPKNHPEVSEAGMEKLADKLLQYQTQADWVVTQSPSSSPYIWYLFRTQFDPQKLSTSLTRYPATEEGFQHVEYIDNIWFTTFRWEDILEKPGKKILILKSKEISDDKRNDPKFQFIETVYDDYGNEVYQVWQQE